MENIFQTLQTIQNARNNVAGLKADMSVFDAPRQTCNMPPPPPQILEPNGAVISRRPDGKMDVPDSAQNDAEYAAREERAYRHDRRKYEEKNKQIKPPPPAVAGESPFDKEQKEKKQLRQMDEQKQNKQKFDEATRKHAAEFNKHADKIHQNPEFAKTGRTFTTDDDIPF